MAIPSMRGMSTSANTMSSLPRFCRQIQAFHAVGGRDSRVALPFQHAHGQLPQVFLVFHDRTRRD